MLIKEKLHMKFLFPFLTAVHKTHEAKMKKHIICFVFLLLASNGYTAPFENLKYTVRLPNDSVIDLLISGDEYYRRVHDQDGYTILLSQDGYPYYAILDEHGSLTESIYQYGSVNPKDVNIPVNLSISKDEYMRKKSFYEKNYHFTDLKKAASKNKSQLYAAQRTPKENGNQTVFNNIVISISFPDAVEMNKSRAIYDTIFSGKSTSSLYKYYDEVSYGKLNMKSTFFPSSSSSNLTYIADNQRNYYREYNETSNPIGYIGESQLRGREHNLLRNAVNALKTEIEASLSPEQVDIDNDGNVDNITFIIQGNADGWSDLLWAHRWSLYSQEIYIHGKRVMTYIFQPENQVNVSTLCHEMFHVLGAPDLYHYDQTPSIQALKPVGDWDLMGSGTGHMGAYMKYAYGGWIDDIPLITEPGIYSLKPLSSATNENVCYKIKSEKQNEYFVLEYRKKEGLFENNIYGTGLVAYRINTSVYPRGNRDGPPDEVYAYRPYGSLTEDGTITQSFFSAEARRTKIGGTLLVTPFLSDGTDGVLRIKNIGSAGEDISFEISALPVISGNNTTEAASLKFFSKDGTVYLSGLETGKTLSVWSILGKCIVQPVKIKSENMELPFPEKGIYILNYDNKAVKVNVK